MIVLFFGVVVAAYVAMPMYGCMCDVCSPPFFDLFFVCPEWERGGGGGGGVKRASQSIYFFVPIWHHSPS